MIRESLIHGLPEPIFQQRDGEFAAIIERDWLTEKIVSTLNLNDHQCQIINHLKITGRISNQEYQQLTQTLLSLKKRSSVQPQLLGSKLVAKQP